MTPPAVAPFTRISIIEASHYAPGTAYIAANRYQLEDMAPYIYKTTDYGRTWRKIVNGIPATEFVRAVREDPVRPGLLFAGTERGVWVSFDDGASWQSLRLNLPIVPVHDLALKEGDLVAATHGRSFWILDDISPLRQLSRAVPREAAHLFKPREAYRVDWSGGFFGGGTDAHPVGKNPPNGAMIYYWLKEKSRPVALDILDGAGRLIRSFTSKQDSLEVRDSVRTDSLRRVRTDSLKSAGISDSVKIDSIFAADTLKDEDKPWPRRPPAEPRVPNKAGLNMFAWNLRYPGPRAFWGMTNVVTDGPMALPGAYRARLTVGGKSYVQSFALKPDPRSKATPADLRAQFAFLKQVRDTVNAVTTAVITIRNVRTQLEDRMAQAPPPATVASARALADRLGAIGQALYQVRSQADEDALVYPPMAAERISTLSFVAGSPDARPTAQSYDVFRMFAPEIDKELVALHETLARDLPAVNAALKAANVAAVVPRAAELRPPESVVAK